MPRVPRAPHTARLCILEDKRTDANDPYHPFRDQPVLILDTLTNPFNTVGTHLANREPGICLLLSNIMKHIQFQLATIHCRRHVNSEEFADYIFHRERNARALRSSWREVGTSHGWSRTISLSPLFGRSNAVPLSF
jgi:hypothetical protein